jgi:endonuclease/exonuclease/phosphatase family metal-dependent hydrolase
VRSVRWVVIVAFALAMRGIAQESGPSGSMPRCLEPVPGVTWDRWMGTGDATLNAWCDSVGRPVLRSPVFVEPADIAQLQMVSWNVHVGGGEVEQWLPRLRAEGAKTTGLVLLLQEAFRGGADVPESYPRDLHVPGGIHPRRPTLDIVSLANAFDLFVAYVPSMRNGSSTSVSTREDRGNAILSTEPITDVVAIELPFGRQRRVAIAATVTPRGSRGRPIRVIVLHFDTDEHRVMQADYLAGKIKSLTDAKTLPVLVAGDLNARKGLADRTVAAISAVIHRQDDCGTGRTFGLPLGLDVFLIKRLDYMFSTLNEFGLTQTCETLDDRMGSDHVPVVMTTQF